MSKRRKDVLMKKLLGILVLGLLFTNNLSAEIVFRVICEKPQGKNISKSTSKFDGKVNFDKFIDDIVNMIKDSKIKYFYKNEFKSLFFDKIKYKNQKSLFLEVDLNLYRVYKK